MAWSLPPPRGLAAFSSRRSFATGVGRLGAGAGPGALRWLGGGFGLACSHLPATLGGPAGFVDLAPASDAQGIGGEIFCGGGGHGDGRGGAPPDWGGDGRGGSPQKNPARLCWGFGCRRLWCT